MGITLGQVQNIAAIVVALEQLGINVYAQIRGIVQALHPGLTDDQLNAAVDAVVADATQRRAEAAAAAGQTDDGA